MAKRVLIVDDAVFMRMKLRDILEKNGYEVAEEAENGQDAFDKYQAVKPDLVTMDITMPEVDGIEALKLIRNSDDNAKVVMCSAMGQQGMVMEAIRAGAVDFIVKPFDTDRVIKALDKALS
ncbi:response regulator [Liquorilactobacillus mali]|uniref:Chemotaxis protein CheY n=1 Tax=Liquorilactobacillus mali KCTC 3596 = DSM 20444 TaxID=1046596 RepID=J1F647_9LACO|nr:response regulator [Liquorilactobacillus mali]AJA34086.1 two-component system chemotaxis family response regulator CheY [Liquorilactobacillus mali KCTC 3596 = DSM 20444]EJF02223.1 chemotaxis protein CheY [Liquorilactobacillus mali KCTC 3596 = DSM 20444]KRN11110.1 chemotaxis protein CheY [Liquorilactobacillus mali KCTC 3596 = DSM 20444]MDC7953948.1 response regulator [Liquorilactobacillus mali]MDV7757483.1 response regulator [Liquorilactobacillus mali]